MNRRKILSLFAAAPVAAKQVAEEAAAKLANVDITGIHDHGPSGGLDAMAEGYTTDHVKKVFQNQFLRNQVRDRIWEDHKHVYAIDYDLASKRSFSLAAKICYQRQRNVERELERMQRQSNWEWLRQFMKKHGA